MGLEAVFMSDYIWAASANTTLDPTPSHLKYLGYAQKLYAELSGKLQDITTAMEPLEAKLEAIGAPKIRQ